MLRYPDVSKDRICFVYANDIWTVAKTGGEASPLSSPPGGETFPRFSPDGKTIAFVGNYDGNRDLYTLPLDGGIPTRVTHHPASEALCDWTPDGKLLFLSNGFAGLARQTQLFTVDSTGGMPEQLPVPYGGFGAISPDGVWLAYTPHTTDTRTWKRYRGGMATDVWLFNLKDKTSKKITDWEGTDTLPMWIPTSEDGKVKGDSSVVYYLSDNGDEHRLNIWSYNLKDGKRTQVTLYNEDDIHWPSIGPGDKGKGEIVFQLGAEMRLLDLSTRKDRTIKVTIPGDKPTLRPKSVDASKHITSATVSPTGKRVIIEARGDLWSAPAKEGVIRNLTHSDAAFERSPAWSPDGKWIAYFSDESGEYELWLRPSDGLPPKEDKAKADKKGADKAEKKDGDKDAEKKDGEKKDEAKDEDEPKPEPKSSLLNQAPPKKLTNLGPGFRYNATWSPDSKHINFTDKAGNLYLLTADDKGEWGEPKLLDTDPLGGQLNASWSQDSGWLTYSKGDDDSRNNAIWVYNVKGDKKTRLTSPMFSSQNPCFDRKGEYIFFTSNRSIEGPTYADIDNSFVYTGTELMYAAPLRKDMKSPFAPKSDEEELKKDEPKKDEKPEKKDEKKDDAKKDDKQGEKKDDKKPADQAQANDAVSGTWEGKAMGQGEQFPPEGIPFSLHLTLHDDGTVTGTSTSHMGNGTLTGTFDKASGAITLNIKTGEAAITLTGTVKGEEMSGGWASADGTAKGDFSCKRTAKGGAGNGAGGAADKGGDKASDKKDKPKEVKIDLEGFEHRAIQLPIPAGGFGGLQSPGDGKVIYLRVNARRGGGDASIKLFDLNDDAHDEKTVTAGGGGFELSADGKKLLVQRGSSITIMDPSAGGGKSTTVPTAGMKAMVNPRDEWKQIFTDVWRLERDFFYEPTMHGVDWPKMREHYGAMIDDCTNREDVAFVIGELISELNIGHAYVTSPGDVEAQPTVAVGMLGCDYKLEGPPGKGAYKITKIYQGADWDADARGPLSQPGVKVQEGDYLLAVNSVPVDTSIDPWAAFIDTADRATTITVGKNPTVDDQAHDVLLKPMGGETALRTRAWIESKRKYVDDKTKGEVGYIYVPNTGVDGQSELVRQFLGQRGKAALVIDERWNGGGQIPTRFIEMLNRPVTNYWARRDGKDWVWPPDGHQGPKCMLINGLAGSGGDAFPYYFKQAKLGPVIGMRTWGGLVGISGNPGLIDGGAITVPTFGFYKTNGTWGVEGHGVDPDIEVVDDPAKMQDGGDPQLDRAIDEMTKAVKDHPYTPPKRPASPNRSGMGSKPEDR
jgi:tricorn protease-like protein/C-terminal processing protease CtpA/Prc